MRITRLANYKKAERKWINIVDKLKRDEYTMGRGIERIGGR